MTKNTSVTVSWPSLISDKNQIDLLPPRSTLQLTVIVNIDWMIVRTKEDMGEARKDVGDIEAMLRVMIGMRYFQRLQCC